MLTTCCLWFPNLSAVQPLLLWFSLSSFKCGRFSTDKMVSKEQWPVKSCCISHIIQSLVMAVFIAESVLWSVIWRSLGTRLTSSMKAASPSFSGKENKGCWLRRFKKFGFTRGNGWPHMLPLPILLACGKRKEVHYYSESSEQQCSRMRRGLCGQSRPPLQCYQFDSCL